MPQPVPERYRRKLIFPSADAPVTVVRPGEINGSGVPHDHDFYEIQVILGGRGLHWTIHGRTPVRRGEAFLLRPGAWHAYRACRRLRVLVVCFGSELLGRELRWAQSDPLLGQLLAAAPLGIGQGGVTRVQLRDAALNDCQAQIEAMAALQQADALAMRADQIGRLLLLLAAMARAAGLAQPSGDASPLEVHSAVLEAIRCLEEAPAHAWTLTELARRVHLERSYLVRLFKACVGQPPMAYLAHHRAELAASLLLKSDRPVGEVGATVGWDDPNHFARRFRAHFGISATKYREELGGVKGS